MRRALETRLGRTYSRQKRQFEDLVLIERYFSLAKSTFNKYTIVPENTYSFDETSLKVG